MKSMRSTNKIRFSKSSLQDFVDCKRKFELKYLLDIKWPAIVYEPYIDNEIKMIQGQRFHHLIHQHQLGIPTIDLNNIAVDLELEKWWEEYLHFAATLESSQQRWPERNLLGQFSKSTHIMARYDLILKTDDTHFVIIDWKTSEFRTPDKYLVNRIQSRLYPMLLCHVGSIINNEKPINPDQIQMIYWFANFPNQSCTIQYSEDKYESDHQYILSLIDEISQKRPSEFEKTNHLKLCNYCNYRSLCDRGIEAGLATDAIEESQISEDIFEIDLNDIGEIEF